MTVTPDGFRAAYAEFADPVTYSDAQISAQLAIAALLLPAERWGTLLDVGVMLYVAHQLALSRLARQSIPGTVVGAIASQAVGQVSVRYSNSSLVKSSHGPFNLTLYGQQFTDLAALVGAGPLQFGTGGPDLF